MSEGPKFFGIYRGTVVNNIDPMQIGRIMVTVPDVSGITPSTWAMPCAPVAGKQSGVFMVPQIGSGVWLQFEAGDPDRPVWTGGWWGLMAEVPTAAAVPPAIPPGQNIIFQTTLQHSLILSDAVPLPVEAPVPAPAPPGTGGVILRSPSGATIVVNDTGIYINNGKGATIEMIGPSVMINKVALVVT
ncbi:phage baseplate assembly protein V [Collimonas sp. H4R21]|uniref:Phage baseplate assembly protein V n=1 Tax=Collimonas rhizosphaerae TaxID=3126357 RepID=A0ABU9PVK3_9BURK